MADVVVSDPASELVELVRGLGDPAPSDAPKAARSSAELIRRRFGLALPPPFAGRVDQDEPVRPATALDGPAIASVKWRCFGSNYRGVMPDGFLDSRDVVPPPSYWTGRAMVPPSRRHHLLVWGRPGRVFGYVDTGPTRPDDEGIARRVFLRGIREYLRRDFHPADNDNFHLAELLLRDSGVVAASA